MGKVFLLCVCVVSAFAVQAAGQCPVIKVVGPAGITNPGENVVFQAEINVVGPKLSYSWSIDKGTIMSGQGTKKITVDATGLSGEDITATVDVGGLPENCERTASEATGIAPRIPCGLPADEWYGEMKPNDRRGLLDVFFAELANNPESVGLIVLRVLPNEKLDPSNSRIRFVLKHIEFRDFDKSRIWIALELSDEVSTRIYRMPPGADLPSCEGCLWFKGEHL